MPVKKRLHNPEVNNGQETTTGKPGKGSISKFVLRILDRRNSLESVLHDAETKGALVEEVAPGEYQVTQKQDMEGGKLSHVNYNSKDYYVRTVSHYEENSVTPNKPIDVIKYYKFMSHELPVVKRIMRDGDDITYYILDRGTKLGVEFSGYDEKGNKVPNKEQIVRILGGNNETIKTYTGEDSENALLVPIGNETDRYSRDLLDIKEVLSNLNFSSRILDRQAKGGTEYLINSGKQFKPEDFISVKELGNTQRYVDFATNTAAFIENLSNYNEFAKLRNLRIREYMENGKQVLRFKNSKNYIVREIIADPKKGGIKSDTFFQLTVDGDVYQSATRNGKGEIISRTINEFRPWWGKANTVTLDYEGKKATSGTYLDGELTNVVKNIDFSSGELIFGNIASMPTSKEIEK